jgi:hypothetical protein
LRTKPGQMARASLRTDDALVGLIPNALITSARSQERSADRNALRTTKWTCLRRVFLASLARSPSVVSKIMRKLYYLIVLVEYGCIWSYLDGPLSICVRSYL